VFERDKELVISKDIQSVIGKTLAAVSPNFVITFAIK
jgi:hypothetical protein